ncbi:hypothetical protein [Deinococcus navajonensis]|uniref:Contractile injection system tube protein N-terminal domain-containing protein n=1 Tax=Deinococcus navajonensis TaxID=309884 RepID=A0ABV8XUY1_9DEIO
MFTKAQIVPLDGQGEKKAPITCMFNPREYTITRDVEWGNQANDSNDAGNKVYKGGSAARMTLELFFDTYANRKSADEVEDVRKYTGPVWELIRMDPSTKPREANPNVAKSRPPTVLFQWGGTWHFTAVITNIEQQFTLFMADGTPVRSVMKVTFEQADKATHFYGEKVGRPRSYNVSQNIRNQAASEGFVGDLRRSKFGQGG